MGPGPGPDPKIGAGTGPGPRGRANFGVRARARAHVWYVFCVIIVFYVDTCRPYLDTFRHNMIHLDLILIRVDTT